MRAVIYHLIVTIGRSSRGGGGGVFAKKWNMQRADIRGSEEAYRERGVYVILLSSPLAECSNRCHNGVSLNFPLSALNMQYSVPIPFVHFFSLQVHQTSPAGTSYQAQTTPWKVVKRIKHFSFVYLFSLFFNSGLPFIWFIFLQTDPFFFLFPWFPSSFCAYEYFDLSVPFCTFCISLLIVKSQPFAWRFLPVESGVHSIYKKTNQM